MNQRRDGLPLDRGVFNISIDLELAWGIRDHLSAAALPGLRREREIVERLLALFADYDVSATWAVVGGLLALGSREASQVKCAGEWHDERLWYGADIVSVIRRASPVQEVGSHSFAHVIFDERKLSPEEAEIDVQKARERHAAGGLPFDVFVYPRNVVGFTRVLADNGIRVFRGSTPRWYMRLPGPLWKPAMLVDYLLAVTPPVVSPSTGGDGLVNIPDSMLLLGRNGVRRFVPAGNLVRMATAGLDRAATTHGIFHLWFHPANFAYQMDTQFAVVERILDHARMLREREVLRLLTMGEIAAVQVSRGEHG